MVGFVAKWWKRHLSHERFVNTDNYPTQGTLLEGLPVVVSFGHSFLQDLTCMIVPKPPKKPSIGSTFQGHPKRFSSI